MKVSKNQRGYIIFVSILMGIKNLPLLRYDPFGFFAEVVGGALVASFLFGLYNYVREGLAE